jgi:phosphoribosylglycinamide formyltransferase-1
MTVTLQRIGVLVSGGGSNLQAIIDAVNHQELPGNIAVVVSNKPGVFALERAKNRQIPTVVIDHRQYGSSREFSLAILRCLQEFRIDLVCLAGFLRILDPLLIQEFRGRILNIHPALLPAFGGKGMYGHHVHEAVIASGAKFSGATVHLVTSETDIGPIVKQEIITVTDEDTADTLAAKVLQIEHRIYPEAIKLVLEDKLIFEGCRTRLKK